MDPFTLLMLTKGAGALAGGAQNYSDAAAIFGKTDEERLKALQRREELGALGFTGEEQNRMMRDMLNPIQARERQRSLETRQILGAGDLGASQSAIASLIGSDASERARAGASETFLQQDLIEKRKNEAELLDLKRLKDDESAAKRAAIIDTVSLGLTGEVEAQERKMQFDEELRGQARADAKTAAMLEAARLSGQGRSGTKEVMSEADIQESSELTGFTPGSY